MIEPDPDEPVERVAQAMYHSVAGYTHTGTEPWDTRIRATQEIYRIMARAALEEIGAT